MVQRGQRELSQNLARKICTRIYSLRDVTVQLEKKEGLQTLFRLLKTVPTVYCFKFFFSSFCKMAYRRISGNEVVHTSVHEIYTVLWVESRFSVRKGNDKKGRKKKNRSAFLKPPCKN